MNVKECIIERLRKTKRENIENVIDYMNKKGFFISKCYKHHKYEGGLADHAWQTYQIALRLNAENCEKNPNAIKLDEDNIAIATLLHDFCKCSGMSKIKGHGFRSARILKELGFKLTQDEFLAIRFHMSLRGKESHFLYNDALKNQLRYLVHTSDYNSSKLKNSYSDNISK